MVHAALLLLMLEAAQHGPRFTISLKRSTQNLQLSTSRRPITPSLGRNGHQALEPLYLPYPKSGHRLDQRSVTPITSSAQARTDRGPRASIRSILSPHPPLMSSNIQNLVNGDPWLRALAIGWVPGGGRAMVGPSANRLGREYVSGGRKWD